VVECRQLHHRIIPGLWEGVERARGSGAALRQGAHGVHGGQQVLRSVAPLLRAVPAEEEREETPLHPGPSTGTHDPWAAARPRPAGRAGQCGQGHGMGRGSGAGFGDSPSTHPVATLGTGFSAPPLAVGESTEGGDGVSSRQPPAQPRLSAAVGCWLFAGRLVLGPLTSQVLLPGSHHVHPMLQVLPETLQGNQKLGETRAAPEPTLQPPTPPHPTPCCLAVQCSSH